MSGRDEEFSPDLTKTDEVLMSLFQRSELQAFQILFERYHLFIINFAYRFLASREEAEDIAQEVFLRIYKKKISFDTTKIFRPWIFAIAAHLISNKIRDKKRHPHLSLSQTDDKDSDISSHENIPDPQSPNESESAEKKELIRVVQAALDSLPENQRIAVILSRYESMSYDEVATTMKLSKSSVTSLLFRARQTLKDALSDHTPIK